MSETLLAPNADRFDPLPPERSHVSSDFAADTTGHFPHFVGLKLEEVRCDYARMRLPFRAELNQPSGVLHGGAVATLIDTVVVPAISSAYEKKPVLFTVNFQVQFLAPVHGEDAVAEGWVEKRGGSTVFCRAEVRSASGELASTGSLVYKVIPRA
jgi:uncharacterized protein (TIGR00369 family)